MNNKEYVWYACYGSNLSSERFKCYIEGGVCKENGKSYSGCTNDKSLWTDSKIIRVPGKMFFGNSSSSWGGKGVAFYNPDGNGETIMRLYKITKEQLYEVQRQEGKAAYWYGRLFRLGPDLDGCEIYTITNEAAVPANRPSDVYLDLIRRALIEECGINASDTEEYLQKCME